MRIKSVAPVALAAVILALGQPPAFGQEATAEAAKPAEPPPWAKSPWSARLTAYLWMASISGDVGVGRLQTDVDVDFDEIFDHIDWFPPPIMLAGEVRNDRVAFFGDFIYLGLEADKTFSVLPLKAEADLKQMIWTFGGSYRVVEDSPVTLDVLAGARLWMLDANLTLTGPLAVRQGGRSEAWIDPIVGIAGQIQLGGGFALRAEGDVGGFGVGADLDWQVLGTLQYQLDESFTLEAGYRYLSVDYDNGGFLYDVALQGPIIGGSIRF